MGDGGSNEVLAFDEFGVPMLNAGQSSKGFGNPFNFTSYQNDGVSGLLYAQNRYFASDLGRFTAEDPIKAALNWYEFCYSNPLRFIDPSGLIGRTGNGRASVAGVDGGRSEFIGDVVDTVLDAMSSAANTAANNAKGNMEVIGSLANNAANWVGNNVIQPAANTFNSNMQFLGESILNGIGDYLEDRFITIRPLSSHDKRMEDYLRGIAENLRKDSIQTIGVRVWDNLFGLSAQTKFKLGVWGYVGTFLSSAVAAANVLTIKASAPTHPPGAIERIETIIPRMDGNGYDTVITFKMPDCPK